MNKIAVIGSNCFTGSHIVNALLESDGNEVFAISRSPENDDLFLPYANNRNGNFLFKQLHLLNDFKSLTDHLDEFAPEIVINVAALSEVALSIEVPKEYYEVNTLAVVNLCNHLRKQAYLKKYVHISSAEIFGSCKGPVREDSIFLPSTPYAASKAAADMYINTMIKNFNFPATIIRSTNVYGKHQQLFKIIPRTAIYLKLGKTIELHGGGNAVKSFIHVRDVVNGMMMTLENGYPGTYHFSVSSDMTVSDIVRKTCDLSGYDFENSTIEIGERKAQDGRYLLDCSKAENELGWTPKENFESGISEIIEWIDNNWDEIKNKPLVYIHKT